MCIWRSFWVWKFIYCPRLQMAKYYTGVTVTLYDGLRTKPPKVRLNFWVNCLDYSWDLPKKGGRDKRRGMNFIPENFDPSDSQKNSFDDNFKNYLRETSIRTFRTMLGADFMGLFWWNSKDLLPCQEWSMAWDCIICKNHIKYKIIYREENLV